MIDNLKILELNVVKETVAKYCCFSLGKEIINDLVPQYDRLIVTRELQRTRETLALVIKYGSLPFIGLKDITDVLNISQKDGICQPFDLLDVAEHAYCCESLVNFLKDIEQDYPEIDDLVYSLNYSIKLSKDITSCIEPNGEISDNASSKLKSLRKQMMACEASLHATTEKYIRTHANSLTDNISTIRNDRVVVLVKNSDKNSIDGFIHGESASGQSIYMEPEVLLVLNNQRLSIISQIKDEIQRILFALSQKVKVEADYYLANLGTLALLDSYNAKALWGKQFNGTLATLGNELIIEKARHPLIDPKKVVANTYKIIPPCNTLLITGPNTGGKTVSLKIIGLFVLMSMCGMAVSCETATIPLFDEVFVDIGDNQSIVDALSTFSAHLQKLAYICEHATVNSLILLDELGGGTDPIEGECLAIAVLDYLRKSSAMIVATTHYDRLKMYGKKHQDILLASVQFDVEKLQPTYRYIEGLTGQSNALDIASKFGLRDEIVKHAKELKIIGRTREDVLMEDLEKAIIANQQQQDHLKQEIYDQELKQAELDKQLSDYQANREQLLETAKDEANAYIQQIHDETDQLLREMRQIKETGQLHEAIAIQHEIDLLIPDEVIDADPTHDFMIDEYVSINNTNQKGKIVSLDKKKATVNVNGLKIHTKLSDLRSTKEKPPVKKKTSYRVEKPESLSFELNLIGYHIDEAIPVLDKYLDDCILMNAPYIRIIHGFGTGALRKAIWSHLSNNNYIDDMRLGMAQEGGSGATIVTLKRKK